MIYVYAGATFVKEVPDYKGALVVQDELIRQHGYQIEIYIVTADDRESADEIVNIRRDMSPVYEAR